MAKELEIKVERPKYSLDNNSETLIKFDFHITTDRMPAGNSRFAKAGA